MIIYLGILLLSAIVNNVVIYVCIQTAFGFPDLNSVGFLSRSRQLGDAVVLGLII